MTSLSTNVKQRFSSLLRFIQSGAHEEKAFGPRTERPSPTHLRRTGILAAFTMISFACFCHALLGNVAQRQITVEGQHRDDPVTITKVMLRNSEIQCGLIVHSHEVSSPATEQPVVPFSADSDWLKDVTLYLLNRTNKTVVCGQLILAFPETGDGSSPLSPMRTHRITLGRIPRSAAFYTKTGRPIPEDTTLKELSFAAGETKSINIGEYIDELRRSVDNMPLESISKCWIRRGTFYFDDGMRWFVGRYAKPDPDQPGKFIPMDPKFFPGIPSWPPGYGMPGYPGYPR